MLFLRALALLLIYDVMKVSCPFKRIYMAMNEWKIKDNQSGETTIDQVSRAIDYACAWYPKQVLCLQRSFATTYLLRKRGFPAHMILGAQKIPFRAHAWVEIDGQAVNERSDVRETYAVWDRC
jgi:hypothetical protein